jgi:hypothetical protein
VENSLTKGERDALVAGGVVDGVEHLGEVALWKRVARDTADRVLTLRGRRFERDNLVGDAMLAAVEASRYFDPANGTRFSTYAMAYLKNAMRAVTDERDKPDVRLALDRELPRRGRSREGQTAAGGVADRWEHKPDDLRHADFLTDDMRAALDLLDPVRGSVGGGGPSASRRAVVLVIEGHDPPAVAVQLDLSRKDVRLVLRNAGCGRWARCRRGWIRSRATPSGTRPNGSGRRRPTSPPSGGPNGSGCGPRRGRGGRGRRPCEGGPGRGWGTAPVPGTAWRARPRAAVSAGRR